MTDNLTGRWDFEDNALDTAPNGTAANNGALVNGPTYSTDCKVGTKSMSFSSASSQSMQVADQDDLNATDKLTICLWIKPASWPANACVFQKGLGTRQFHLQYDNSATLNFRMQWWSAPGISPLPATGTWCHIACTYDGAQIRIYKDGVEKGSVNDANALFHEAVGLGIGARPNNSDLPYNGLIDDVRIYKGKALTAEEIGTVMSVAGVAAPVFTPAEGTYDAALSVTISTATAGANIRYTLDGTDPAINGTEYTGPVSISETTTLRAIAVKENKVNSYLTSGVYVIQPPVATIAGFVVTDQTSGSSLVTNAATVDVAITVDIPEGVTVTGYVINETGVEPTGGWADTAPTTYTIEASSGATVTLYAWIKDSNNQVASKSATIYYNTATPAITAGPTVTDNGDGIATATWTTDIPALGSVNYGPVKVSGATPNIVAETAIGTSHGVVLTGIVAGTNYKIVLVNSEIASPAFYWPDKWPVPGDASQDCRVNILDLIFIRNKLNQAVGTGDNWKADVNEDARINILDLILVRNRLNTQCPQ
ncbi:MAG TPA: LamG-like jellyroll fold domain-containing protein [Planctomycetota bacterium]|nr:LamG-like jellyroll fold domain-containing protein [Planctomycetota bacterium]